MPSLFFPQGVSSHRAHLGGYGIPATPTPPSEVLPQMCTDAHRWLGCVGFSHGIHRIHRSFWQRRASHRFHRFYRWLGCVGFSHRIHGIHRSFWRRRASHRFHRYPQMVRLRRVLPRNSRNTQKFLVEKSLPQNSRNSQKLLA